jgi:phosphoglycerol transferase MdoB-like AlkP superfamily enzyme
MTGRLKFLFVYYIAWIFFFELSRLLFLLYNFSEARKLSLSTSSLSFWYGMRMDASMAAYILLPVCLFVLTSLFLTYFRKMNVYRIYTGIVLFFILLIVLSDLEIYKSWGFRIDATPLKYLTSPREVWASISHLPLLLILLLFILVFAGCYFLWNKLVKKNIHHLNTQVDKIKTGIVLLLATALLIIPMRGGLQLTPMNQSIVYFSKENFANISAINAPWNFMYGVTKNRDTKNPYIFLDSLRVKNIVDSLYSIPDSTIHYFKSSRPNVIVIVWESFTEKATHAIINGKEVTPGFNKLKQEGIYFSHLFASGDRTDKGIAATLSGYPALNNFSVIHQPAKSAKLPSIGRTLKSQQYNNYFYYGGEPEFANIKSYILQSEYDELVEKKNFKSADLNSKWGAHDGSVAARLESDMKRWKEPFFTTWLTLTSHEPFETPVAPYIKGNDITSRFLNSLHYTDSILTSFVEFCRQQASWNNTLIVIIADHGHPLPEPSSRLDNFKIPMLWLGGVLEKSGVVIDHTGSQLDLAATLMDQLGIRHDDFPFSKNLFNPFTRQWAYFSFNNGFGFVQPQSAIVYDNVGNQIVNSEGKVSARDLEAGKAMQQFCYQDYLEK